MKKKLLVPTADADPRWLNAALLESGISKRFRDKCRVAAERARLSLLASSYVGVGKSRLMLYSNEPILGTGLETVLRRVGGFELLPTCNTIPGMMDQLAHGKPDLLLMDLTPEINLAVLSELKHAMNTCKIVLWVNSIPVELAFQAMGLGVRGILRKALPTDLQVKCLQKVLAGELWFEKALTDSFLCARRVVLTQREGQVVSLLSQGLKNRDIATRLMISESTVKVYLSRLFQKVGVKDRFELALFGLKNLTTGQLPLVEKTHPAATPMRGLRHLVLERPELPLSERDSLHRSALERIPVKN